MKTNKTTNQRVSPAWMKVHETINRRVSEAWRKLGKPLPANSGDLHHMCDQIRRIDPGLRALPDCELLRVVDGW
jgi:hypothetical protein